MFKKLKKSKHVSRWKATVAYGIACTNMACEILTYNKILWFTYFCVVCFILASSYYLKWINPYEQNAMGFLLVGDWGMKTEPQARVALQMFRSVRNSWWFGQKVLKKIDT